MSFDRFPFARATLEKAVRDGVAPGFVAGVWLNREPGKFHLFATGERRLKLKGNDAQPMEVETIFDLASISKVFSTATLAALLVERRWITYETRLQSILPEFQSSDVTISHLLSHTAGLPAWAPLFENLRADFGTDELPLMPIELRQARMRDLVFAIDLERGVEQRAVYSDLSFLLLGFALERLLDLPLDVAADRYVFGPMKLGEGSARAPFYHRTRLPAFQYRDESVAATEDCPWRKTVLQGQVHDDNCWAMGGYGGHAGVFGTASQLLRFSKALQGGFLSPAVLKTLWTRVPVPAGCDRTLGWDTPSGEKSAFGSKFSRNSVGHLGFTGTSLWIDRDHGVTVALLSNRVHPSRGNEKLKPFRAVFHDALASDIATDLGVDSLGSARQNQ